MHLSPAWTWCEWVNSPRSGSCRTGLLPPAVAEPVRAAAANTDTLKSKITRLIQIPPRIRRPNGAPSNKRGFLLRPQPGTTTCNVSVFCRERLAWGKWNPIQPPSPAVGRMFDANIVSGLRPGRAASPTRGFVFRQSPKKRLQRARLSGRGSP
jgi:hypothetical protein